MHFFVNVLSMQVGCNVDGNSVRGIAPTPSHDSASDKFMPITKSLLNTPADHSPNTQLTIDGLEVPGHSGELLIDLLNRRTAVDAQKPVPQVCYVKQMGPIESCDTCLV